MNLKFLLFIPLLSWAGLNATDAYCQKAIADTVALPVNGKSVKSNELFFEAMNAKMHNDEKKAIELFEQFVAFEPKCAAGYYELAKYYGDDKKPDKAEANIKKAIALSKDNKWYTEEYANILARQGKYAEAGELMAGLADKETSDADYASAASEFFDRGQKYDRALVYIDKAIMRSGSDEEILLRKVQLYIHMNEIVKAADIFDQLIARDPKNGKYYKFLGDLYDNSKMPDKALEAYQKGEKAIPGEPLLEIGLSEHYLKLHDSANFRVYARKAILNKRLDVSLQTELFYQYIQGMGDSVQNAEGLPLLVNLLEQHPIDAQLLATYGDFLASDQQIDKAIEQYKKSLVVKAANFEVWNRLLNAYAFKSNGDSLVKYSEKVIRLFPNQAIVHYYNGIGHYNKKEYPAAIKALNRAVDMLPETDTKRLADMYSMLGEVYNMTKQHELSDQSFDKALKNDPNNATVLNNYSYFLSERGQKLEEAKTMSEKSLQLRPNEATFLDTYGWILYKKGEYDKARENIEKAINLKQMNADATLYDHLGDVYYKLNNKVKAVENWKLSKEKGGEDPLLNKKISEEKLYE